MSSRCTRVSPPKNQPHLSNLPSTPFGGALARIVFLAVALGLAVACRRAPKGAAGDSASAPSGVSGVGLAGPTAVLHDPDFDRYYVSNSNGVPGAADDNGFISILSPAGDTIALKWIDGASREVSLSSPRGMAVVGPYLYVADLTTIRRFDRRSGAPLGEVPIAGARSLDDMKSAADGTLYFTDTGDSVTTGAVYRLSQDGKLDTLARGPELGHPTGVAVSTDGVWVVSRVWCS